VRADNLILSIRCPLFPHLFVFAIHLLDSTVEAPPSLRPRKKYCDVTGLIVSFQPPFSTLELLSRFNLFPGLDSSFFSYTTILGSLYRSKDRSQISQRRDLRIDEDFRKWRWLLQPLSI